MKIGEMESGSVTVARGDDGLWWTVKDGRGLMYYSTAAEAQSAADKANSSGVLETFTLRKEGD